MVAYDAIIDDIFSDGEESPEKSKLLYCFKDAVRDAATRDFVSVGYRFFLRAVEHAELTGAIEAALAVAKPVENGFSIYLDDALGELGLLQMVKTELQGIKSEMCNDDPLLSCDQYTLVEMWSRDMTVANEVERPSTNTRAEDILLAICERAFDDWSDVALLLDSLADDAAAIAIERDLSCDDIDGDCVASLLHEVIDVRLKDTYKDRMFSVLIHYYIDAVHDIATCDFESAGNRFFLRAVEHSELTSAIEAALSVAKPAEGGNAVYLDDALKELGLLRQVEDCLYNIKHEMYNDDPLLVCDCYDLVDMWSRGMTVAHDEQRPRTNTRAEAVLFGVCQRSWAHWRDVRGLLNRLTYKAITKAQERGLDRGDIEYNLAMDLFYEAVAQRRGDGSRVICLLCSEDIQTYRALEDFDVSKF